MAERPDDLSSADAELDRVLLTQHDAVFTLGTGSTLDNLRFKPDEAPFGEVVRTERGGEVTYHGPGQVRKTIQQYEACVFIWLMCAHCHGATLPPSPALRAW